MVLSKVGEDLIKSSEELRLTAYLDDRGIPTIGWGHTLGVHLGMTCTEAQAEQWFLEDMQPVVSVINRIVLAPLTQNQFDALCSLAFNVGIFAFRTSTLVRLLNDRNYAAAANEFVKWDHEGRKEVPGLLNRRKREQALFNT